MRAKAEKLDDRMAMAIEIINDRLAARRIGPMSPEEEASLRSPTEFGSVLFFIEAVEKVDLSHARSLLEEWHAWHS